MRMIIERIRSKQNAETHLVKYDQTFSDLLDCFFHKTKKKMIEHNNIQNRFILLISISKHPNKQL